MGYCINCGTVLAENAKFCQKCGKTVSGTGLEHTERRIMGYEGRIYKCPNCGEVLRSFVRNCPACGLELRSTGNKRSIREFALKLEAIEAKRDVSNKGFFDRLSDSGEVSGTDAQKISLIQSFSVPNTKEDMLEFMILATSNINQNVYDSSVTNTSKSEKALNSAWEAKIEQVYKKAKLSYGSDRDFHQIEALYEGHLSKIKKQKRKGIRNWILMSSVVWGLWLIILILKIYSNIVGPGEAEKENARLERIEQDAICALEDGEYKKALLNAEGLVFNPWPKSKEYDEMKRQWDIRRELLIDQIIEEAEKNGVYLERSDGLVSPSPTKKPIISSNSG